MGEQLCYTWSDTGFGVAVGFRVRAASKGLMDTESERVRTFVSLMSYYLPQYTDPYLPPQEAPRCLAFLRAGSRREPVLINKTYTGSDGMNRPGNYFSHLLAELPAVFSPRPERQIEFSAREAIALWGSRFWKDSDNELPVGRRDLEQFSLDDLNRNRGLLAERDVARVADLFRYVLSAFLTLPTLGEQKRLYIAASPDLVAALIWGLTYALPRTLTLMRTLTFNTFVHDIEDKAAPVIVGTCWLPQHARSGRNTPQDLLPAYYQPNNPYGVAINGYQPDRATPFTPDPPEITKFVEFAVNCFVQNTMEKLTEVIDEAEQKNVTEVSEFLGVYAYLQEKLTEREVINTLSNLFSKVKGVIERTISILGKPASSLEMPRWESLQLETKVLRQENVRRSILHWMTEDPTWWRGEGKQRLSQLCQLADAYNEDALVKMGNRFTQEVVASAAWRRDHGQSVSSSLRQFTPNPAGDDPGAILTSFAQVVMNAIHMAQNELAKALIPLANDTTAKVLQMVGRDDDKKALFWADALATITPARAEVEVWTSLLHQFSAEGTVFTSTYQQWWTQYGQGKLIKLRSLADESRDSDLARAIASFRQKAAMELQATITSGTTQTLPFWEDVLVTIAPYASEPSLWLYLLQQLRHWMYTPAFQQWWQEQGKGAAKQVRRYAESNPQRELTTTLSSFLGEISKELHVQIVNEISSPGNQERRARIVFLLDLLSTTTPSTDSSIWTSLLHKLSPAPQRIYEVYSWDLRALLLQTWARIPALRNHDLILRDWLFIRWSELGRFLKLELPEEWTTPAIDQLVMTPLDIPPQDMVSIVNLRASTFEVALQQLIKGPATQREAIDFFTTLTQYGYLQRVKMLGGLIIASDYQPDIAEKLFAAAHIESGQDVTELLEHHCKLLLTAYPLPPTLLNLIRTYLSNFDVSTLQTGPTRELLQRLQQRNTRPELLLPHDLQASVELWGTIAEFIDRPDGSRNWLRSLRHTLHGNQVLQLTPEMRTKLADELMPTLVSCVSSEADVARMMDNLGQVLMGSVQGAIEPDLLLLEQMMKIASEKYGQDRPPARLVPYIRMVLGEARYLPSPRKEEWIDRCLRALLNRVDDRTCSTLLKNNPAYWPDEIFAEWKAYLKRDGAAAENAALTRLRAALQSGAMSEIVDAYDPILDTSRMVANDEWRRLKLALQFVQAYKSDDDAALVAAYNAIAGSPYGKQLRCSQEQFDRLERARSRMSSVPRSSDPIHAVHPPSPPSSQHTSTPALPQNKRQTVPAANQRFVAVVKSYGITPGWFAWVVSLKYPYTQYRITTLQERIEQLKPSNLQQDKQELKRRQQELKELKKLPHDDQQLQPLVLDDLVDDVLIEEDIAAVLQTNQTQGWNLDPEPDLPTVLIRLSRGPGRNNSVLRSDNSSTVEQIKEVLRIFRRRELFADYLDAVRRTSLHDWLKERRRSEAANIQIDYEQAGVKPPKGSGWLF